MNLFELFVKIGVDDQASGNLSKISSSLGKGLSTAAKIGTAAVATAAAGITALTTAAVNNYAEYEQLVGGVETLFKTSADKVVGYAENAYKTAGLSANEYMETVTSFSASLLQSLDEDTEAATEYANQAITDMADNANKMGTSMEMIQNAYQGFAKQNYSMLDNLKLGYGGTASEMYRLLQRAAELDEEFAKTANFSIDSKGHLEAEFADITQAIHIVQTEMGITGTTALEAGRTISGSVGSMKAAWTNLVTGFADGSSDIGGLIDNLVTTIVGDGTESNLGVIGNVLPAIETALGGISKLIEGAAPKIIEILPGLVDRVVPSVISAATGMVNAVIKVLPDLLNTVVDAIIDNAPMLIDSALAIVGELVVGVLDQLPQIVQLGFDLIVSLASGISENMNELVATGFDLVQYIVDAIIENAPALANAAFGIIDEFGNALAEQIPGLSWVFENLETAIVAVTAAMVAYKTASAISGVIDTLRKATEGQTLAQTLLNAVMNANPFVLVATLIAGLVAAVITLWNTNEGFRNAVISAWESIKSAAEKIFTAVANFFTETIPNAFQSMLDWISDGISSFVNIGYEIVDSIMSGISAAWNGLVSWFNGIWNSLFGGLSVGVNVNTSSSGINGSHAGGLDYVPFDGYIAELHKGERVLTAKEAREYSGGANFNGDINIIVQGDQYRDEKELASALSYELQNLANRRAAVYA